MSASPALAWSSHKIVTSPSIRRPWGWSSPPKTLRSVSTAWRSRFGIQPARSRSSLSPVRTTRAPSQPSLSMTSPSVTASKAFLSGFRKSAHTPTRKSKWWCLEISAIWKTGTNVLDCRRGSQLRIGSALRWKEWFPLPWDLGQEGITCRGRLSEYGPAHTQKNRRWAIGSRRGEGKRTSTQQYGLRRGKSRNLRSPVKIAPAGSNKNSCCWLRICRSASLLLGINLIVLETADVWKVAVFDLDAIVPPQNFLPLELRVNDLDHVIWEWWWVLGEVLVVNFFWVADDGELEHLKEFLLWD